jgi:hypothetical protein
VVSDHFVSVGKRGHYKLVSKHFFSVGNGERYC